MDSLLHGNVVPAAQADGSLLARWHREGAVLPQKVGKMGIQHGPDRTSAHARPPAWDTIVHPDADSDFGFKVSPAHMPIISHDSAQ